MELVDWRGHSKGWFPFILETQSEIFSYVHVHNSQHVKSVIAEFVDML